MPGDTDEEQLFDFQVKYKVAWTIGGNANNGLWPTPAGHSAAGGNAYIYCEAEPDDSDADHGHNSFWDGARTEWPGGLTGLGISIWGVSGSWDNTDDVWNDATDATVQSHNWSGHLDNNDSGTIKQKVILEGHSDCDCAAHGTGYSFLAESHVDVWIDTFTFTLH